MVVCRHLIQYAENVSVFVFTMKTVSKLIPAWFNLISTLYRSNTRRVVTCERETSALIKLENGKSLLRVAESNVFRIFHIKRELADPYANIDDCVKFVDNSIYSRSLAIIIPINEIAYLLLVLPYYILVNWISTKSPSKRAFMIFRLCFGR